jgi:hypothetical protein
MKCQLIGYQHKEGIDKKTGNPYKSCQLCFVRKPSLSETGFVGTVCFSTKVYDDAIKDLPELVVDSAYNVDCRQYNGKFYLDEMTALK